MTGPDIAADAADGLRTLLTDAGYRFVEPPILQEADIFLDLAGEDLRRRLFLTQSAEGTELCLRPDFTIPVCLHHIAEGAPRRVADYAYLGPVFRQRSGESAEFRQAGVESIGRTDFAAADADTLALALDAVDRLGLGAPLVRIGDSGLFAALLDALILPEAWKRRLARAFGDPARMAALVERLRGAGPGQPAFAGFLAALDGTDHAAARQVVDDLLSIAGITTVGGRSAAEIADRFLEQAALNASVGIGADAPRILEAFLAVAGHPGEAAAALEALMAREEIDIGAALTRFRRRLEGLEARGIAPERMRFSADFGRRLDYYTGFVFEIHDAARPEAGQVVGGGRYDRLLSLIVTRDGSGTDIPAVGFAIWLDRLAGGTGAAR